MTIVVRQEDRAQEAAGEESQLLPRPEPRTTVSGAGIEGISSVTQLLPSAGLTGSVGVPEDLRGLGRS